MTRKNLPFFKEIVKRYWKSNLRDDMVFLTATSSSESQKSDHPKPHFHNGFTMSVLEDGFLPLSFNGHIVDLHPGEILIIGRNIPHMVDPRNLIDPCSYRTVTIDEKFLSNSVFSKIQKAENAVSRICDKNLWEKFVNQQKEIESGATGGLDSMKTLSEKVFYEISKNILFHTDVESPYIQSAMKYIQENYMTLPSVEELARIVNLSPFYFMKLFKQELGVSPHAYINQLRINRAKDLMQKGESLLGIAYELGFTDQSHFSKTFLKTTGVSPIRFNTSLTSEKQ